ncbi:MAG: cation:proton antiporter [Opitutaceae bacterium]
MHGLNFIQDLAVVLVVAGVVGWICQRIGLSVVVGFLAAGMVLGPKSSPFSLVHEVGSIEALAQLGLVFLMFSIGLKLSLRKLQRLGFGLMFATFGGALIMYYLTRVLGAALGWSSTETLFLAGILMVSSSAIISKILHETGANHEHSGQLAMGVAILEDVVAVVMLALLGSLARVGGAHIDPAGLGETLLTLGAFVVLAGVVGLLLVPWLLRRLSISADEELQTLGLAALLFVLAVVATRAGYSLALGAFLLGTIVAETSHRHQVERTFEGMRDVFSAVFFVAIGMQIDVGELWLQAGLIIGVAAFTLFARPFAVSTGLVLIGTPMRDALRAGMTATPIGEFSFIIAQLGVGTAVVPGLVPPKFYPLAVGVSLLTTLAAPLLIRRSAAIADKVIGQQPRWLQDWLRAYHGWLDRFRRQQKRNKLWQLSRKRFFQIGVEALFVTGLLLFADLIFEAIRRSVDPNWLFRNGPEVMFWVALCLVVLAPVVAIWRNCSALALLFAQVSTTGHPRASRLAPIVEATLKILAAGGMFLWLAAILPTEGTARWLLLSSGLIALAALLLLRRQLVFWHSQLEVELHSIMETGDRKMNATTAPWLQPHSDWNLQIIDCVLPDLADSQGKKITELDLRARFGCSVVGIERQGFMIPLPPPDSILYPRDKVLLLGTADQVRAGRDALVKVTGVAVLDSQFEEVWMQSLMVPGWSRAAGHTLGELSPAQKHGVQIAGVNHGGQRVLNPSAHETILANDELLVLGTPVQIREFKLWLEEQAEDSIIAG